MNNDKIQNEVKGTGASIGERIFERARSENINDSSILIIIGLIGAGIENLKNKEFVEGAKRVIDIAHEEYMRELEKC